MYRPMLWYFWREQICMIVSFAKLHYINEMLVESLRLLLLGSLLYLPPWLVHNSNAKLSVFASKYTAVS